MKINFMKKKIYCFLFLILQFVFVHAQTKKSDVIIYSDTHSSLLIGGSVSILEDKLDEFTFKEVVISKNFVNSNQTVPDLGISRSAFWIKAKITNSTNNERLLFELANPTIDEVELYILLNGKVSVQKMGEYQPFHFRNYDYPSYVFDLVIPSEETVDIYLKIKSKEQISVPLKLGSQIVIMNSLSEKDLLFGLYVGIMLAMFFYNAFIYFTTKDRNYLYYIIYILFVGLTQSCLQGYTFQYLWSNSPWMAQHSIVLLGALVGITAAEFAKSFLNISQYLKSYKNVLYVFYVSYFICIIFSILEKSSGLLLDITALSISLYLLGVAIVIARKGYRPAKFFLFAWIIFLIGVIVFALKNMGVLPYNNITIYTMPAGSAIEALLLSFALADRINLLKKEKDFSQAATLLALRENEMLIKEQNIILEQMVEQRTIKLNHTNAELNATLSDLIDTQTQLVNAEKMASLGQLTAGIAHEINNPINFVSANVKPLKLDIEDVLELVGKYEKISLTENLSEGLKEIEVFKKQIDFEYLKKEMTELLTGIEEGAMRTAEIVSGLKNFSRLDESEFKMANINEGIKSTLILLKSSVPADLKVITDLGNIPAIECFPGKLNQVFMNLFNNAIYAINKNESGKKQLLINTYELNDQIFVSIEDTGIGMTPEVKAKVFEPFYTTKDVGEGTGLGMAIVFKIIESHHAKIEIESEYGIGTKILLILNKKL